jgi:hypothetical protein
MLNLLSSLLFLTNFLSFLYLCNSADQTTTTTTSSVQNNSTFAAIGNYLQQQSKRHAHGHAYIRGSVNPMQFFRATFGGLIPCGSRDFVVPSDPFGCTPLPVPTSASSSSPLLGRYVFVRRGICSFTAKALNMQRGGAAGVAIMNHDDSLFRLAMANNTEGYEVVIPVILVVGADYEAIHNYSISRNQTLHGSWAPVRDDCIDPQVEDEERKKFAEEGNIPYTASLAARVSPSSEGSRRRRKAESAVRAAMEAIERGDTDGEKLDSAPDGADVAAAQQAEAAGDLIEASTGISVQTWPPLITEAATLKISPPVSVANADGSLPADGACAGDVTSYLPDWDAEAYLAEFSAPVLGDSAPLIFAQPPSACVNFTNSKELSGKFVIVLRGDCTMVDKARRVQDAGGLAAIIVNFGAERSLSGLFAASATVGTDGTVASEPILSATAATSTHSNPSFGIVRAVGDQDLKARPVTIPVVMVSAATASTWAVDGGGSSLYSIAGCIGTLRASRAQSLSGWEELEKLREGGKAQWPEDSFFLQRMMLRLLRQNHPKAALGHPERLSFVFETADIAGFGFQIREMERMLTWEEGVDLGHVSDDFGRSDADKRVKTISGGSPGHSFLISNMPSAVFVRKSQAMFATSIGASNSEELAEAARDFYEASSNSPSYNVGTNGILGCSMESGQSFVVRLSEFDRTSTFSLTKRLKDLLQQQACLEKLLVVNAGLIGGYLHLLREESTAREWRDQLRGLLRPFRVPDVDTSRIASSYIELSRNIDQLQLNDDSIATTFGFASTVAKPSDSINKTATDLS